MRCLWFVVGFLQEKVTFLMSSNRLLQKTLVIVHVFVDVLRL